MVDQLAKHAKALEEKDREIIRLKQETVSKDDPELWKQCPNCARMHERLSSNSNDDKQKILRLEREIERHIMEHLQAAIQFRTTTTQGGGDADSAQLQALKQELNDSNRRNKELQQLIAQSPVLTTEVKQRAARIASHRDGAMATTGYTNSDWSEVIAEKEREIKHLKGLVKETTFRHVQELESIRAQFQRYDDQIVEYLEKVFSGAIQPSGGGSGAAKMAAATARAAKEAVGGYQGAGSASATALRMQQQYADPNGSNVSPSRFSAAGGGSFRTFDPVGAGAPAAYGDSPSYGGSGGRGGVGASPSSMAPPQRSLVDLSPIRAH